MNKSLLSTASILFLAVSLSTVSAGQINGAITFSGGAVLDNTNIANATSVISWVDPLVSSRDGDFIGLVDVGEDVALVASWSFASGPVDNFWSVGGFSFDLASSSPFLKTTNNLIVNGTGFISGNGFDSTAGNWSLSSQAPSAGQIINGVTTQVFSFSASAGANATSVPDGGTTAVLLGASLIGLGLVSRRRAV